jgi:hypothetical protein
MSTQNDGLLWLNDHRGAYVTVALQLDTDEPYPETILSAEGSLEHWTNVRYGEVTDAMVATVGTVFTGLYDVGRLSLDLTRIDESVAAFEVRSGAVKNPVTAALTAGAGEPLPPYEELRVGLGPRLTLCVTVTEPKETRYDTAMEGS